MIELIYTAVETLATKNWDCMTKAACDGYVDVENGHEAEFVSLHTRSPLEPFCNENGQPPEVRGWPVVLKVFEPGK